MASNIVNSSVVGVNLQGNSDGATAQFGLGQHVVGNAGSEWIYVTAAGALTTGSIVAINSAFTAKLALATDLFGTTPGNGMQVAFTQGAFAASDFGWVVIRGANMVVAASNVSTLGAALYVSTNSGIITTAAGSGTLAGIILATASASGVLNAATVAYLQYPRLQVGATFGV